MKILTPACWKDYELIDSGDGRKLERFGGYVIARPEPQALWNASLPPAEWERRADALFTARQPGEERGEWRLKPHMPEQWVVGYDYGQMNLRLRLGLTSFKHVGLFPEQADNWNFIYDRCSALAKRLSIPPRVLNLFAYTGGASLAAAAAGADVTHVDSVRQTVSWSRENRELSALPEIRWVVEDAMKFTRREVKRGKRYEGIVLDPPSYGRGPEGEKWILEEHLHELLAHCAELLADDGFLVLNLYSMGLSALLADTLVRSLFKNAEPEIGELCIPDSFGKRLPLGVFVRFPAKD